MSTLDSGSFLVLQNPKTGLPGWLDGWDNLVWTEITYFVLRGKFGCD